MLSKWFSRKLWITVGSLAVIFFLEYKHPGSATNLQIIVPALVSGYLAANHGATYIKNKGPSNGNNAT